MRHKASLQPHGTRKALRNLAAASVVGLVGLAPSIQLAHLASLDHGHQYCEEHHRIEDIPRGRRQATYAAWATLTRERIPLPIATAEHEYAPNAHVPCPILNCCALCVPLLTSGQTAGAVVADRGVAADRPCQEGFVICPLLLSAPKTSPPLAVA
ncbi:MAG: hypothetical protein JXP73_13090 [Deltaproteobacteria bacterium]|nr:hypothetical protein [Deltaproteobacteria bacterium]